MQPYHDVPAAHIAIVRQPRQHARPRAISVAGFLFFLFVSLAATSSFATVIRHKVAKEHVHHVAKKKAVRKSRIVHRRTNALTSANELKAARRRAKRTHPGAGRIRRAHVRTAHVAAHRGSPPRLLARCGFTPASRRKLFSRSVYIVDEPTHTPLYARNADTVLPIASVSKLMTAVVWLDQRHVALSHRLSVTDADLDTLKFTHSRLAVGASLSRADMLHIALMSSENRAAAALSRDFPGGRPAFVRAMNAEARQLGMRHTYFVNSTGLSPRNVSTARELARLVRAANRHALIRRYTVDHQRSVFTGHGRLMYVNSNRLVRYGVVRASLQKTGFINESGHNMVMRMLVHGRRPVVVTMLGSASAEGSRLDGVRIAHWLTCSLS